MDTAALTLIWDPVQGRRGTLQRDQWQKRWKGLRLCSLMFAGDTGTSTLWELKQAYELRTFLQVRCISSKLTKKGEREKCAK